MFGNWACAFCASETQTVSKTFSSSDRVPPSYDKPAPTHSVCITVIIRELLLSLGDEMSVSFCVSLFLCLFLMPHSAVYFHTVYCSF